MSWWDRIAAAFAQPAPKTDDSLTGAPTVPTPDQVEAATELHDGLYSHWNEIPWPVERWPNFTAEELACPCCGEAYIEQASLDMLQEARRRFGGPLKINSAHRCEVHNAHVGGAPASQHKLIAYDVSIRGRDRWAVLRALEQAGFTTFGFYQTFIHTDIRPGRRWYSGEKARQLWAS